MDLMKRDTNNDNQPAKANQRTEHRPMNVAQTGERANELHFYITGWRCEWIIISLVYKYIDRVDGIVVHGI